LDYYKYQACSKQYLKPEIQEARVQFSWHMLEIRPNGIDWRTVLFYDEIHFGLGPEHTENIVRKPGERYNSECIQDRRPPPTKRDREGKRLYVIPLVGYDFLEWLFYTIPTNDFGKISTKYYISNVLPRIKHILLGRTLQVDKDNTHFTEPAKKAYKDLGIDWYINLAKLPDLTVVESVASIIKYWYTSKPQFNQRDAIEWIKEVFDKHVKQKQINKWVDGMPDRLKRCIAREG
jgi:hypothetical protein